MSRKKGNTIDLLDLHGCLIRGEDGTVLARLYEQDGTIIVKKTTACTVGTYFYILRYLRELGVKVR